MVVLADNEVSMVIGIISLVVPLVVSLVKLFWELTWDIRDKRKRERRELRKARDKNADVYYEICRKRGKKYLLYAAGLLVIWLVFSRFIQYGIYYLLGILFGLAIMIFFVLGVIYFIKGRKKSLDLDKM